MSSRLFLLRDDDTVYRLADAAFMRMLRQEDVARLPDFAGQRVRLASFVVETADRVPLHVLHATFSLVDIGTDGLLDVARLNTQQAARAETLMAGVLGERHRGAAVVDAASRFVARGDSWQPDHQLLRRIESAALGRIRCRRVRVVR